jgi:hypothetical protein
LSRLSPDAEALAAYRAHSRALKDAGAVWDSTTARTAATMEKAGIKMWFPVSRGRGSKRRVVAVIPYSCNWSPGCALGLISKGTPVMVEPLEVVA